MARKGVPLRVPGGNMSVSPLLLLQVCVRMHKSVPECICVWRGFS